jgi:hypothetical protein
VLEPRGGGASILVEIEREQLHRPSPGQRHPQRHEQHEATDEPYASLLDLTHVYLASGPVDLGH